MIFSGRSNKLLLKNQMTKVQSTKRSQPIWPKYDSPFHKFLSNKIPIAIGNLSETCEPGSECSNVCVIRMSLLSGGARRACCGPPRARGPAAARAHRPSSHRPRRPRRALRPRRRPCRAAAPHTRSRTPHLPPLRVFSCCRN